MGGAKFVNILMHFCFKKLRLLGETSLDKEEMIKLRIECENAKIELSTENKSTINIHGQAIIIERAEYERLIQPFVDRTMKCVENAIDDADLDKDEIHHIVLVGGGTFTPLIRQTLRSYFGKEPHTDVNPMEAGEHTFRTMFRHTQ